MLYVIKYVTFRLCNLFTGALSFALIIIIIIMVIYKCYFSRAHSSFIKKSKKNIYNKNNNNNYDVNIELGKTNRLKAQCMMQIKKMK